MLNLLKELLFKICLRDIIISAQKLKHILKHAAGRTRSRYKFYHCFISLCISFPCVQIGLLNFSIGSQYTIFNRSCRIQLQKREAFFETCQLFCNLFFRNAFLYKQFFVLGCYHIYLKLLIDPQKYKKNATIIRKIKKKTTFGK